LFDDRKSGDLIRRPAYCIASPPLTQKKANKSQRSKTSCFYHLDLSTLQEMREVFPISLSVSFIALLPQCFCFSPQRQHCYFGNFESTVRVSHHFGPRSTSLAVFPRNTASGDEADRSSESNLTNNGYLDSLSSNNNQKNEDEASEGSNIFKDSWSTAASKVTNVVESGANEFKSAANAASTGIGSAASAVTNVVGGGVNAASTGIGSAAFAVTNVVGAGVDVASTGIGSAASNVTNAVGAGVNTVGTGIGSAAFAVTNMVGEGVNAATAGIGTAASTVTTVVGAGANTVGTGIGSAAFAVTNVVGTGASAVTNAVGTGAGKVEEAASWIDSQAKLGTQQVGSQAKSLVLKFTGKDDYQFGDVAKETFRRILSQEVSISDMILLLKILLAVGASIGPLAQVLPFTILLQGLNMSIEKHIGGKVLEAFATSLDTRLVSAFTADDTFLLGDAVKRSMLTGVLAFTGKETYQAGDLQLQIAAGGQEQLNIVLDPELEAWDKSFTESIEIQKQKEELALLYTDTNGNRMNEEAAKELDTKLVAELEEWSSVFRKDYSDFGLGKK